jgi:hypothetical protein
MDCSRHGARIMKRSFYEGRNQRGAIAIIVALSIAVLVGFAGLALDLGKLYITKSELQASADACALSAARELTGASAAQLTVAEAAGITTGARNLVMFQGENAVLVQNDSVQFSATANGGYLPKDGIGAAAALTMKFARCRVERNGIANWLIEALNVLPGVAITSQNLSATAVASVVGAQTNCGLPVALCNANVAGKPIGTWLVGVIGPPGGAGSLTGNFLWVDFTPPSGGASELAQILHGPGACNIPSRGAQVGQPGNIASAANDWNSRFGIYSGGLTQGDAVPDFTGFAYTDAAGSWPSQFNAYPNFITRRTTNDPYQGDASTGLNIGNNATISTTAYLAAHGADRRLAIAPIVNCDSFITGSTAPVLDWACVLMLHPLNTSSGGGGGGTGTGSTRMFLEYRGPASSSTSPCATLGTPGGPDSAGPKVPVLVQ